MHNKPAELPVPNDSWVRLVSLARGLAVIRDVLESPEWKDEQTLTRASP